MSVITASGRAQMGAKTVVVFIDGFPFPWPASTEMAQFREEKYDREENICMASLGAAERWETPETAPTRGGLSAKLGAGAARHRSLPRHVHGEVP